eukprot:748357-Hanusia_phi.AAC.1
MPIALVVIPLVLIGGVVGAIGFASQETEDMSPAEQTKRLNSEARERMERDEELKKKIVSERRARGGCVGMTMACSLQRMFLAPCTESKGKCRRLTEVFLPPPPPVNFSSINSELIGRKWKSGREGRRGGKRRVRKW